MERVRMQFRTEVFNLFNTPNFSTPSVLAIQNYTGTGVGTNVSGFMILLLVRLPP